MARNLARWNVWMAALLGALAVSGCGMVDDRPLDGEHDEAYETRRGELGSFCQVEVDGYGSLSVEEKYLAQVVTCEHSGAPFETLKAQAIAARGYAKYVADVERRPLSPTVRDQAYNCGRAPTAEAIRAVRETSGMVLTHQGKLIMPFYVAGSTAVDATTCKASGRAGTQRYVTYNQGHLGSGVHSSTLGWTGSPANRGAMSQNGSACLARKGWGSERILRFFYGDDIRVTKLSGSCVDSSAALTDPASQGSPMASEEPSTGGGTCEDGGGAPQIMPRSSWNARAPRYNRPRHTPNRFTIHHTVTANNDSSPRSTIRRIQADHQGLGWADIGYHYVIDSQGTIYAANPVERRGAHTRGANTGNVGIAMLGNYETAQPKESQLAAAGKLIRHLADKYGIAVEANTVHGHRDRGATACPGRHLYSNLDRIIRYANGEAEECEEEELVTWRYVRLRGLGNPDGQTDNDIAGFDLDAVHFEQRGADGGVHTISNIVSSRGVSNAGRAEGLPDATDCGKLAGSVAGVPEGAELVVEFDTGMKNGDQLFVTQAAMTGGGFCSWGGSLEVAVSTDGESWQVVRTPVLGNTVIDLAPSHVEFAKPTDGSSHQPLVQFEVEASEDIAEVEYLADDWSLGVATQGPEFRHEYEFQNMGLRHIEARAYNADGDLVATDEIDIEVARDSAGGVSVDQGAAETLGAEGGTCSGVGNGRGGPRCTDGRGGWSSGLCWAYVKAAMVRSGQADRADIAAVARAAGMTNYAAQVSAAGFKRAADAAPGALQTHMGLRKANVSPTAAPRGAVIAWSPGCLGANSRYGHIEIAQGDGYACSDYCAPVRGDASCASVYVPTR